ncbi:hypothetical protein ACO0LL_11270 [Undibacterium sp. TC4M20W]|uniref:hypothetical protein n=1 Tax=Undibacterium sp. TC4M20W TaxID=3413052 RepID=UPI003BF3C094
MPTPKQVPFLTIEEGKFIRYSELAGLIAKALHPDDSQLMEYGAARINLKNELRQLVLARKLIVRNESGLQEQTLLVGDALNQSVLMEHDLFSLLKEKGIELRKIPYGSGPQFWTIENAASEIASQQNWHQGARDSLKAQMLAAAKSLKLTTRDPHTNIQTQSAAIRDFYELVTIADVNAWLAIEGASYRWNIVITDIDDKRDSTPNKSRSKQPFLPNISLLTTISPYFESKYSELTEYLRAHVDAAFYPCPEYWDTYTRKQREAQINDYDLQYNPFRQVENKAVWWSVSMDASIWWNIDSITPLHAAMLLARLNPNKETEENAHQTSSDEMGPEDFKRLKNAFDGSLIKTKTLKEWIAYARKLDLKFHSWILDWEVWLEEKERLQSSTINVNVVQNSSSLPGITKQQVITAFASLHYSAEQWGKYLASPPKWLAECRITRGSKSVRKQVSMWNPVEIAIALSDSPRNISIRKLDSVFNSNNSLKKWQEDWVEKSENFR